jgi:hypothetical protein
VEVIEYNPEDTFVSAFAASFPDWSAAEAEVTAPISGTICAALEPPGMGFFTSLFTPSLISWPHHVFLQDIVVSGHVWYHNEYWLRETSVITHISLFSELYRFSELYV